MAVPATLTGLPVTEEEYLELCDEDTKVELISGALVVSTPVSFRHEQVQGFLLAILRTYVEARGMGVVSGSRTPMRLDGEYFEPDLVFVAREHLDRVGRVVIEGPADLVIEIISPDSAGLDRVKKRRAYERHGVREYWIIDPDREEATFCMLGTEGRYLQAEPDQAGVFRSAAIEGLWLNVAWLWADPLPPVLEVLKALAVVS